MQWEGVGLAEARGTMLWKLPFVKMWSTDGFFFVARKIFGGKLQQTTALTVDEKLASPP